MFVVCIRMFESYFKHFTKILTFSPQTSSTTNHFMRSMSFKKFQAILSDLQPDPSFFFWFSFWIHVYMYNISSLLITTHLKASLKSNPSCTIQHLCTRTTGVIYSCSMKVLHGWICKFPRKYNTAQL